MDAPLKPEPDRRAQGLGLTPPPEARVRPADRTGPGDGSTEPPRTSAGRLAGLWDRLRTHARAIGGALTLAVAAVAIGAPLLDSKPPAEPAPTRPIVRSEVVPGKIVVDFRDDVAEEEIRAIGDQIGILLRPNGEFSRTARLMIAEGAPEVLLRALEYLRADPRVEAAEPSFVYKSFAVPHSPDDPYFSEQWNLKLIGMEAAWDIATGKGVTVAVIDSGVSGRDTAQNVAIEDIDPARVVDGFDFVEKDDDFQDAVGHGTHVAGTIAGSTGNGRGVAGIAFDARILPVRVLNDHGSGETADIADGIRFAADRGAKVINMSLGGGNYSKILEDACAAAVAKGAIVICAAGNDGREGVSFPAAYPSCLAVSSVGPTKALAPYSNWGREIAIAAPGGDMSRRPEDGVLQNVARPGQSRRDIYVPFQGTSMAAPHVAGVAALIMSLGIDDVSQVRRILVETAEKAGDPLHYGGGVLDAEAALERAKKEAPILGRAMTFGSGLWAGLLIVLPPVRRRIPGALRALRRGLPFIAGLAAPAAFGWLAGATSVWNLLGHSALWVRVLPRVLPAALAGSRLPAFAAGLALHLLADARRAPGSLPADIPIPAGLWLFANLLILGFRFLVTPAPRSLAPMSEAATA